MALQVTENASLKNRNSFGVEAHCRYLVALKKTEQIREVLADPELGKLPRLLLGGGSNILFREDFPGVVVHVETRGVALLGDDEKHYFVRAAAGENWHAFVQHTIEQGWAGLENLSLIPGTVGAAPIQNIGAYGVELDTRFHALTAIDLGTGEARTFDRDACQFRYRNSLFKQQRNRYLVSDVTFRLPKNPTWALDYAGIREKLPPGAQVTARAISMAVCQLRQEKLPDPAKIGNAGSFFQNPQVSTEKYHALRKDFPDMPSWPTDEKTVKLSAAWLIEQCGWKGHRENDAGVSEKHALVLVNHGRASGAEIWQLAEHIIHSVKQRFGITLQPEPFVL